VDLRVGNAYRGGIEGSTAEGAFDDMRTRPQELALNYKVRFLVGSLVDNLGNGKLNSQLRQSTKPGIARLIAYC
jgi:hypothetical protein